MKRDSALFIQDIIDAMNSIERFVGKNTLPQIKKDEKTLSAVIRKFEVIGEAAKYLPTVVKEKHKEIKWKSMSGMRDRLIHAYFGIDYDLVWAAIKEEIPKLKPKLEKVLRSLQEGGK